MAASRVISRTATTSDDLDTDYKWGFTIDVESDVAPKGLNEDIVRLISLKKREPEWMLEWRLKAYRHWVKLNNEEPKWANIQHPPIDYQDIIYYAAPRRRRGRAQEPGRGGPRGAGGLRQAGNPPCRAGKSWPVWPSTRSWTAFR